MSRYLIRPVEFTDFSGEAESAAGSFYRPLFWLSLFPGIPAILHLQNLALHALNAILLWRWLSRWSASNVAICATTLWSVFPIHAEAAVWISGRAIPLAVAFLLSSLLVRSRAVSVVLATLGGLSHEIAIIYPFLRPGWSAWIAPAVVALARFLSGAALPSAAPDLAQPLHAVGFYLFPLLYRGIELSTASSIPWLGVIPLVGLLHVPSRKPLLLYLVGLLPFLGFVPIYQVYAERYAYLASSGLALLVAGWVAARPAAFRGLLTLSIAASLWTTTRFFSEVDLYRYSLWFAPSSAVLNYNLGVLTNNPEYYRKVLTLRPGYAPARMNLALLEGDIHALERETVLRPDSPQAWLNFGNALQREGRLDEARTVYGRAIALKPDYAEANLNYGALELKAGDYGAARAHLLAARSLPQVWLNLAVLEALSGDAAAAERYFQKALAAEPDNPAVVSSYERFRSARSLP